MRYVAALALVVALGCSKNGQDESAALPQGQTPVATKDWPPADLHACAQHSDCAPAPDCCPAPCTGNVIHRRYLSAAQAELDRTCDRSQECPSAGGCVEHAYMCIQGNCKLVMVNDPEYPKP